MKSLAWIPYGSAAVILGAVIGYHPPPKPLHAQTAPATVLEPADTRPATFAERWPQEWASFDERWSAAWSAKGIRTITIEGPRRTTRSKSAQPAARASDTTTRQPTH